MLLEVKDLKVQFKVKNGIINAVNDVSFDLKKGEVVAIVGESGSGKSVTSLSIMGLILNPPGKVVAGEIIFNGENLLDKSLREMQDIRGNQISMIFQEPMTSLNPLMTIGNQIAESLVRHKNYSKKNALQEAINLLDMVGIPSPKNRVNDYPHQLSGGMRQRVMIAMALACKPQLLIADEPTTALDVTVQAQILDLMLKLREKINTSILLITHDLGVVAEIADRVAVMYCGIIVERGTVEEIFSNPLHPYTNGLLKSIPRIDEKKEELFMIPGMVPNSLELPSGCFFSDRCEKCMDICTKEIPPLVNYNGREVSCHLCNRGKV